MKQTSPLELGLPVIDLERMLHFYTTVFACEELRRADIPAELSRQIRVTDEGYVNVWLKFPGGEVIKLVRPPTAPVQRVRTDFSGTQTGLAYFTLYCDDIDAAIELAETHGGSVISERGLLQGGAGVKLAFLTDPEGNVFEFVEA